MTHENSEVRPGWEELGRLLVDSRDLTPEWRPAWTAVDRARFLPEVIWPYDHVTGTPRNAVSRTADPATWREYADGNCAIVTRGTTARTQAKNPAPYPPAPPPSPRWS
ncbi:hypothetical protein GCM10010400_31370 [Streptomyces aculeolatus]|uniref:hypothetical protein n=1 Tax=Streptomyces aculeolatus TaxID=270689 RepID=UPI0027E1B8C9|nr:hypothetical protein [Streptomyces aculeolatus]